MTPTIEEQREFDQSIDLFFETLEEVADSPTALAFCEGVVGEAGNI